MYPRHLSTMSLTNPFKRVLGEGAQSGREADRCEVKGNKGYICGSCGESVSRGNDRTSQKECARKREARGLSTRDVYGEGYERV